MEYEVVGDVEPGKTVTVVAKPKDGYELTATAGWTSNDDGTMSKEITIDEAPDCPTPEEPKQVKPQDPTVDQPVCDEDGNMVDLQVTPAVTEGVEYEVVGDVEPGKTVTVVATPKDGYELTATEGWTSNDDGTATTTVEIDGPRTVGRLRSDPGCSRGSDVTSRPVITKATWWSDVYLADTEGVEYEVVGDIEPGATVTVIAKPKEGYVLTEADGWTLNEDGTASKTVTFDDEPYCGDDEFGDEDDDDDSGKKPGGDDDGKLPQTGGRAGILGTIAGFAMLFAGAAAIVLNRRRQDGTA